MQFRIIIGMFVPTLLLGFSALAQSSPVAKPKAEDDRLIVYGQNFAFGVKEPQAWRGSTGQIANKFQANIIFVPSAEGSQGEDVATIRVRVNRKMDENIAEDLNYDMQEYKSEFPTAAFSDLKVAHPAYKTFAKLVFVPQKFYEYVAYLNPGVQSQFSLSVAMSKKNAPANDTEFKAYETVLQSLQWLSSPEFSKR